MRTLLTTLLVAAILINVLISEGKADAHDVAGQERLNGNNPYQTYVPDLLK